MILDTRSTLTVNSLGSRSSVDLASAVSGFHNESLTVELETSSIVMRAFAL